MPGLWRSCDGLRCSKALPPCIEIGDPRKARTDSDDTTIAMGRSGLHEAIIGRNMGAVGERLRAGDDPNAPLRGGSSPLYHAVASQSSEVVDALLQARANPNGTSGAGFSALGLAAMYGHRTLIDLLIGHGADPSMRDASGCTPDEICLRLFDAPPLPRRA
jgi:ankyrin repeat protein